MIHLGGASGKMNDLNGVGGISRRGGAHLPLLSSLDFDGLKTPESRFQHVISQLDNPSIVEMNLYFQASAFVSSSRPSPLQSCSTPLLPPCRLSSFSASLPPLS